jgi:hypothetical protein
VITGSTVDGSLRPALRRAENIAPRAGRTELAVAASEYLGRAPQRAGPPGAVLRGQRPSQDQVEQAWGIEVLQSTQFTAGVGILFDPNLYGRVVVREGLTTRIGYAGTDFTSNIIRLVSEERLTQTIERPQSIIKITGLPTAAPAVAKSTK